MTQTAIQRHLAAATYTNWYVCNGSSMLLHTSYFFPLCRKTYSPFESKHNLFRLRNLVLQH